ncbi:hypothetical protein BTA51_01665 [Hahella sp. CCB-MM4]|uniref:hypothetical protein n=1 Tax=Hahella sp. (strain CCB-MM4) TaxID=1926491 RepID=UPI000B9BDA01|nr:hypothetical protein [Hahella sp. CCB-MM4]OZG75122.1 hypothetical protein BTA51_01665 [Hahella sp. CCB-MM4]
MMLNFRAIITGVVIDIVGSIAGGLIFMSIYPTMMLSRGMGQAEIKQILANPASSNELLWLLIAIGIFFDGLAGYVTARMAGYLEYWHVLAMIGLLTIVQFAMGGGEVFPAWVQFTGFLGGTTAAFFSAHRLKMKRLSLPRE